MSRLAQARPAARPSLKARLMLSGPAGAGKTLSALEIASELGDNPLVIDTEKESALTYARVPGEALTDGVFDFTHLPWLPPFDPRELGVTLQEAGTEHDVIVVDSFAHFWTGSGGTLDIADGRFGGWKTARPAQTDVIDGILSCSAHVIICVRSKIEYVQEEVMQDGRKKQTVKKLGMAPQQDSGLEYELNLAAEIDIEHRISVSKSRTQQIAVGRTYQPGHARDLGKAYAEWLRSGEPFADLAVLAAVDAARRRLTEDQKRRLWDAWKEQHLPQNIQLMTASQAAIAMSLIEALTETKVEEPS